MLRRAAVSLVVVLALAYPLLGCGGRPSTATSSGQAIETGETLGALTIAKTSARVVSMSGTGTHRTSSFRFHLAANEPYAYLWRCTDLRSDSSFRADLVAVSGGNTSDLSLIDVGPRHGNPALGSGSDSAPAADHFTIQVSARDCRWSFDFLAGGRSLVTYGDQRLGFAVTYDPVKLGVRPVSLRSAFGWAIPGSGAVLFANSERFMYYILILASRHLGYSPTRAAVEELSGTRRQGSVQACQLAGAQGFMTRIRQADQAGLIYLVAKGTLVYEVAAVYDAASEGKCEDSMKPVIGSIRFFGH